MLRTAATQLRVLEFQPVLRVQPGEISARGCQARGSLRAMDDRTNELIDRACRQIANRRGLPVSQADRADIERHICAMLTAGGVSDEQVVTNAFRLFKV